MMSAVWGDNHIDWMERALIRSLCWPENNSCLKYATWHMFTRAADRERVSKLTDKVGVGKVIFYDLPPTLQGTPPHMGLFLLQAFLEVMKDCLQNNAQLLMAPVDTIFSEGTVPNLLQMAKYGDTCVAVPHARVSPSIFGSIRNDEPLSGKELVTRLFKHQHQSWITSEIGINNQGSFIGGIAWQKLKTGSYLVQHHLPTIYLANFINSDYQFFQTSHDGTEPVFGAFDHLWPSKLIKEDRQRMPGSSEVACLLEVTKEDQNIPAKVDTNPSEPDAFWRGAPHNKHNRQFYYTLTPG